MEAWGHSVYWTGLMGFFITESAKFGLVHNSFIPGSFPSCGRHGFLWIYRQSGATATVFLTLALLFFFLCKSCITCLNIFHAHCSQLSVTGFSSGLIDMWPVLQHKRDNSAIACFLRGSFTELSSDRNPRLLTRKTCLGEAALFGQRLLGQKKKSTVA